jgi:type II secretory pathway pseudopilin PulG
MTRASLSTRSRSAARGLTVVELLVVLAIAASIMGLSFSAFSNMTHAKLRADAMRLSGALRMVYGRAAINGLRYQVTINMDAGTYRVDCSEENVVVTATNDDRRDERPDEDDPEADPFGLGARGPTLSDCSEPLLEQTALREGIAFARLVTSHHDEPVEEGTHTIAYFPNGFVERSIIWLRQGEDNYLALSIDPMSGRVRIHAGDHEVPDDFFEVEEDR